MPGRRLVLALPPALAVSRPAAADARIDAVLAAFRDFEARGARFDPALADHYADDARITVRQVMPDGTARTRAFRGQDWKAMARQAMPAARQTGDANSFRRVTARLERPDRVLVQAERFNHRKNYVSPFMQAWEQRQGAWRIVEERAEVLP